MRPQALDLVSRDGKHVVSTLWKPEIFSLIKLAAQDKDVTRIFVNPAIKQQLCLSHPRAPIATGCESATWFQHRAHMHVRLRCPADSLECEDQPLPPSGDGCGELQAGLNLQNREQQSLRRRHRLRCRLPARRYWMST
ncbi:penicillin-insensitive murein endopeptidase [Escherichia coli]